jgi:hypothetical protein
MSETPDWHAIMHKEAKRILYSIITASHERDDVCRGYSKSTLGVPTSDKNPLIWLEYVLMGNPSKQEWESRIYHTAIVWYARLHEDFHKDRLYRPQDRILHYEAKNDLVRDFTSKRACEIALQRCTGELLYKFLKIG